VCFAGSVGHTLWQALRVYEKTMKIVESYKRLSGSDIARIEEKLKVKLPEEYREFLLKYNGGKPIPDAVRHEGEYLDFVAFFYAARFNIYADDLLRNVEEYSEYILDHYLPFAESPGGDVYCLSLKPDEHGSVYYWDHEMANYDGEPWEENMIKLARSFDEFLAGLYTED